MSTLPSIFSSLLFSSSHKSITTEIDINMDNELDTDLVKIVERLLCKPEQLEEQCREQLQ